MNIDNEMLGIVTAIVFGLACSLGFVLGLAWLL